MKSVDKPSCLDRRFSDQIGSMLLLADTHVHLYPCYDLRLSLQRLHLNLIQLNPDAIHIALLTERYDCDFFKKIVAGDIEPGITVDTVKGQAEVVRLGFDTGQLYLFAGRQIVTRERIEILALTTDAKVVDGLYADEVVAAVRRAGGIPIISWAPGKWFFARKRVVQNLIDSYQPGELLLGDTSLRPIIWPIPVLMNYGRRKGLAVVAGSDPLPFPGEEKMLGRFITALRGDFDESRPVDSIRSILSDPELQCQYYGSRCGFLQTLYRLYGNKRSQRNADHHACAKI